MKITLDIPENIKNRVIDGLCGKYNYEDSKIDGETKPQFARRMMILTIKNDVTAYEFEVAEREANLAGKKFKAQENIT